MEWERLDYPNHRLKERSSILSFSRELVKMWLILPPSGKNL